VTKRGNYRLFTTVLDHGVLKYALNDEIFAAIIPDLVATNIQDERVVKLFLNLNFSNYGQTERFN
jgi:hypothetical protein